MPKLIIFDWDDVFTFGSTEGYYACYHRALEGVGIRLSPEEERKRIKAKWGATAREEVAELLKEHPELVDKALEIYEKTLMGGTFVEHLQFVEGGNELIDRLSSKYTLAIASGVNPRLLKEKIFPKFGVRNLFSEILTVSDIPDPAYAKPHPYLLLEIMKRLKVSPEESVMVGDAKGDMLMACSAGVRPIAVLSGHLSREEAEAMNIADIIPTVLEIERVL